MSVNFNGQYLLGTLTTGLNTPATMSALFRNVSSTNLLIASVNNLSNSNRRAIYTSASTVYAYAVRSGTRIAIASTTYTNNTWNHALGTFASSDASRTAYLNAGGSVTESTSENGINAVSAVGLGTRYAGSWSAGVNTTCAEIAMWSVELTEDEIVSLSKGFKPSRIRPQNLVFYAPLVREYIDVRDGIALGSGTPVVNNHPRVY